MLDHDALLRAELFFRTYLSTIMPLHRSLVLGMCASSAPPLEFATVLEDIGQSYMRLAGELNETIIRRGRFDDEPDPDEGSEARIEAFLDRAIGRSGTITFVDGSRIDAAAVLNASPLVRDAMRAAILTTRSAVPPAPAQPKRGPVGRRGLDV